MKRSKAVLQAHFVKSPVVRTWKPLAFGISAATIMLTGCSKPISYQDFEKNVYSSVEDCSVQNPYQTADCQAAYLRYQAEREVEAKLYTSVEECVEFNPGEKAQCEAQYLAAQQAANASAPMFETQELCALEFNNCQRTDSGFWRPLIAGFILAEIIDEIGDSRRSNYYYTRSTPIYSSNNGYRTDSGVNLGYGTSRTITMKQGQTEVSSKPKVTYKPTTTTKSRGGFGSTAKAKSSWSSKSSWGG